jgi:CRP-like cAMP-binding protein
LLFCLHKDPKLTLNLFRGFEQKFTALHDKIDILSAGSVEARLAALLLKLYEHFGDEFADGTLRLVCRCRDRSSLIWCRHRSRLRFACWRAGSVKGPWPPTATASPSVIDRGYRRYSANDGLV